MIYRTGEGGLFKKWKSDLELSMKHRNDYFVRKHEHVPFTIEDLLPAFYVLGIGWSLATFVFVFEHVSIKRFLWFSNCFSENTSRSM